MTKKLLFLIGIVTAYYLLRKPLTTWYLKRASGIQAAKDVVSETSYTTYNTQLYTANPWTNVLNFFKPNSNVASSSPQKVVLDYSVQG